MNFLEEHKDKFERSIEDIKSSYNMDCHFHTRIFGASRYFERAPHRPFCQRCGENCSVDIIRVRGVCDKCSTRV
jgi:hypothetical protein